MEEAMSESASISDNQQQATNVVEQQTESYVPQHKVNALLGNARKTERELRSKLQQYEQQNDYKPSYDAPQHQQAPSPDFKALFAEAFAENRGKLEQEIRQAELDKQVQQVVKSFDAKISLGKQKYDDYDSVTDGMRDVFINHFPGTATYLAEGLENAEDIYYELCRDSTKALQIEGLLKTAPILAARELKKLSDSIKQNEAAKTQRNAREPLSQIRPGNYGTGSDTKAPEELSVAELRQRYRF